jgi:MoaA/NifB/PqqE/SkfB family radical SAM enzyme
MRFRLPRRRPLAALQIEVTSRCTRQCAICPRSVEGLAWRDGEMDEATWHRLRDDLDVAPYVHLQGWGEPLLHPRLPEMVDAVKAAGPEVGLTTNGDLLPEAIEWIVDRKVDLVTVSVAGAEATHAALRDGSELKEVWGAVGLLLDRRGRGKRPKVQVSYLLTVDGIDELPRVVSTSAEVGVDELFVTHLDVTPGREFLDRSAFDSTGLRAGVAQAIADAERTARSRGLVFRAPASVSQELLVCALNPRRFAFVGWDGRVGPCVNLLLPLAGSIPRWTEQGPRQVEPVVYGRLADTRLVDILRGEEYRRFTTPFASRLAAESRFRSGMDALRGGEALSRLDEADHLRQQELAAHPLPPQCAGCHKALGW